MPESTPESTNTGETLLGHVLAPHTGDPLLVMVRVRVSFFTDVNFEGKLISDKIGHEHSTVLRIFSQITLSSGLSKNSSHKADIEVQPILSAFALPQFPGRICIETRELSAIAIFFNMWTNVFSNSIVVIPIEERSQLLQSQRHSHAGLWARVNNGRYKGDLALVRDAMHTASMESTVLTDVRTIAMVPRIDDQPAQRRPNKRARSGHKFRPAASLFDPLVIEASYGKGSVTQRKDGSFVFQNQIFRDGLLELKVQGKHHLKYITPSHEEVAAFATFLPEKEREEILWNYVTRISNIRIHDMVDIRFGPYCGASGLVSSEEEAGFVRVSALHVDSNPVSLGDISIPTRDLRVHRGVGDHVQILEGLYRSHQGLVVNVNADKSRLDIYDIHIREIVRL